MHLAIEATAYSAHGRRTSETSSVHARRIRTIRIILEPVQQETMRLLTVRTRKAKLALKLHPRSAIVFRRARDTTRLHAKRLSGLSARNVACELMQEGAFRRRVGQFFVHACGVVDDLLVRGLDWRSLRRVTV